jgi:hypothetical protein
MVLMYFWLFYIISEFITFRFLISSDVRLMFMV